LCAYSRIRRLVSGFTSCLSLRALDTVDLDIFSARAISFMVIFGSSHLNPVKDNINRPSRWFRQRHSMKYHDAMMAIVAFPFHRERSRSIAPLFTRIFSDY
jgi:hypothetical protein